MRSRSLIRGALVLLTALQVAGIEAETTDSVLVHIDSERDEVDRDVCDLVFSLWDAEDGGRRVSEPITIHGSRLVALTGEIEVDFGEDALGKRDLWLDVSVRCPGKKGIRAMPGRSRLQGATLTSHP